MADFLSKKERSKLMSRVKQKNTKPEMIVRKFLYSKGYRYRVNVKKFPGSPDILIRKHKIAIFVNGCYWHGHSCRAGKLPSSNLSYWEEKIRSNIERDERKDLELKKLGFRTLYVWGCELKNKEKIDERLNKLHTEIQAIVKEG